MSGDESTSPEERLPLLLAACDEALVAGAPADSVSALTTSPELQPVLERKVAWFRLVRQLWPHFGTAQPEAGAPPCREAAPP
jgi:hypothetical protein